MSDQESPRRVCCVCKHDKPVGERVGSKKNEYFLCEECSKDFTEATKPCETLFKCAICSRDIKNGRYMTGILYKYCLECYKKPSYSVSYLKRRKVADNNSHEEEE